MHAFTPAKAGAAAFWAAGVTDTIADPAFAGVTDNRFTRIS